MISYTSYEDDDKDEDLTYKNNDELALKYNLYLEKVNLLNINHNIDENILSETIFFVLDSVKNDLISKHYNSPVPGQSFKQLPARFFKQTKNTFNQKLFSDVVKAFVEYVRKVAIINKYTSNVYDISNFSDQIKYLTVIENILIENTI